MAISTPRSRPRTMLVLMAATTVCGLVWVVTSWLVRFDLARARFSDGTDGSELDALQRVHWYQVANLLTFPLFFIGLVAFGALSMFRARRATV